MLKKELGIFTFGDLLYHFPYRHIDKTRITPIGDVSPQSEFVLIRGRLMSLETIGEKRAKRLVAEIRDGSGTLELVWFQGISWIQKNLSVGLDYTVFGRLSFFQGAPQITHPEIELARTERPDKKTFLEPVYSTTEKLKARGLVGRQMGEITVRMK